MAKPFRTLRQKMSAKALEQAAKQADQFIRSSPRRGQAPRGSSITCAFCPTFPTYVAAQSEQAGAAGTVTWVLICDDHANGWNDGGSWAAPAFALGPLTAL